VARVVATRLDSDGTWRSLELRRDPSAAWSAVVPGDGPVLVQAVDTAGNVAHFDNSGAFLR
jgi:hypothetical protein